MTVTDWRDDLPERGSIVDGRVVEVRDDGLIVIEYEYKGELRRASLNQRTGAVEQFHGQWPSP